MIGMTENTGLPFIAFRTQTLGASVLMGLMELMESLVFQAAGQMSPKRLLSNTIGDEMKLAVLGKDAPKVVGISMKDRGAILPAGHSSDVLTGSTEKRRGTLFQAHIISEYFHSG